MFHPGKRAIGINTKSGWLTSRCTGRFGKFLHVCSFPVLTGSREIDGAFIQLETDGNS